MLANNNEKTEADKAGSEEKKISNEVNMLANNEKTESDKARSLDHDNVTSLEPVSTTTTDIIEISEKRIVNPEGTIPKVSDDTIPIFPDTLNDENKEETTSVNMEKTMKATMSNAGTTVAEPHE